jgi:hypothetical protein
MYVLETDVHFIQENGIGHSKQPVRKRGKFVLNIPKRASAASLWSKQ